MNLPFTVEEFLKVFEKYNIAVWPMQIILVLWTDKIVPKYVLVIPLIWSIIGFGAALSLGVKEDYGLLIAGVLGFILIFIRDRKWDHPNRRKK